jgi:hypothetical protein
MPAMNRGAPDAFDGYGTDDASTLALPCDAKRPSSRGYERARDRARHGICQMTDVALPLARLAEIEILRGPQPRIEFRAAAP